MSINIWMTLSGTDANAPAIEGVAVSSTNTYYSQVWHAHHATAYSLTQYYTGTLTGTFTLWYTDKRNPNLANDDDWVQDTTFSPTNPAGAAGKFGDQAGSFPALKKRLKYVNASGSGTLTGRVTSQRSA